MGPDPCVLSSGITCCPPFAVVVLVVLYTIECNTFTGYEVSLTVAFLFKFWFSSHGTHAQRLSGRVLIACRQVGRTN